MELSTICVPFVSHLNRLRKDCIQLGYLLEAKLAVPNAAAKGGQNVGRLNVCRTDEQKVRSSSSRGTQTMPTTNGKQKQSRLLTLDPNSTVLSKSMPPTPPESVRTFRRRQPTKMAQKCQPTIAQPFRLCSRSPVPCRFAKRHLEAMLEERRRKEEAQFRKEPFRAKPVPESTYRPDSDIHIGKLRRNRTVSSNPTKCQQILPLIRHRSVPLSTYIQPKNSMGETKMLRRQKRAFEQLATAKAPRGMEEHSIRWHIRWSLRHSARCLPASPAARHRSLSVPDFALLHAKFQRQLAANRPIRQITTAQPFRLSIRSLYCKTKNGPKSTENGKRTEDKRNSEIWTKSAKEKAATTAKIFDEGI